MGASVAEILLHPLVRLSSGSTASILSSRIGLLSLSFDASTLFLDAFMDTACVPGKKRDQAAGHEANVQPVAGEEYCDHG